MSSLQLIFVKNVWFYFGGKIHLEMISYEEESDILKKENENSSWYTCIHKI